MAETTFDFEDGNGPVPAHKHSSGGWVADTAWVSDNALVFGDALVYGNAWVDSYAQVYGNARVYGDARVFGNALVFGNAQVFGDARVSDNAWVSGNAWMFDDARVFGNAQATKALVFISGLGYLVTISDRHMQIGCELHEADMWSNFTDREIAAMDGKRALQFWRQNRDILLALCTNHMKSEE